MISTTVSRISKSRGEGILFTLMIEKTYDSAFWGCKLNCVKACS